MKTWWANVTVWPPTVTCVLDYFSSSLCGNKVSLNASTLTASEVRTDRPSDEWKSNTLTANINIKKHSLSENLFRHKLHFLWINLLITFWIQLLNNHSIEVQVWASSCSEDFLATNMEIHLSQYYLIKQKLISILKSCVQNVIIVQTGCSINIIYIQICLHPWWK